MIFSYCTHPLDGFVCLNEVLHSVQLAFYTDQYQKHCSLTLKLASVRTYHPSTMFWSDILFLWKLRFAVQAKYNHSPWPRLWTMVFSPSTKGDYFVASEQDQDKIERVLKRIIKVITNNNAVSP